MRQTARRTLCKITTVLAVIFFLMIAGKTETKAEVLPADVTEASDGCILLGVDGSYLTEAQNAIDRINEIRLEACEEGVWDPRNSSRRLTASDYVPIKWSSDLEMVARIRAAENSMSLLVVGGGHYRLNHKEIWTVSVNGISGESEDLAFNFATDMVTGIDQWYEEKADWVNKNSSAVTGHYTSIIDPSFKYIGLGAFYNPDLYYPNTLCGRLSSKSGLDETMNPGRTNITQTLDVAKDYITGYQFAENTVMLTGSEQLLAPKATLGSSEQDFTLTIIETLTYTSSNPSVLTVSNGRLTAVSKGTATVTAYQKGTALGTQTITVEDCDHDFRLQNFTESTCVTPGINHYVCAKCGEERDEERPLGAHSYTYTNNSDGTTTGVCSVCGDTFTATVPTSFSIYQTFDPTSYFSSSLITACDTDTSIYSMYSPNEIPGGVTVELSNSSVVTYEGKYKNYTPPVYRLQTHNPGLSTVKFYLTYNPSVSRSYTLRVGADGSLDIADADAFIGQESFFYTGSAFKPEVTVSYNGERLEQGTDFTVSYRNNTNAGNAAAVLTGKGLFKGTLEVPFTIDPYPLDSATVALSPASFECDGTEKQPAVTVKVNSRTLTEGTDYTVTYMNNTLPGTAIAVVTGKDNYSGRTTIDYPILHTTHTYGEWETTSAPGCTVPGEEKRTCLFCGAAETREIAATGHTYGEWSITTEATCTQAGEKRRTCINCDAYETQAIPATGHTYGDWTTVTEATCTQAGEERRTCIHGDDYESRAIPATGHTYGDWTIVKEATCTQAGEERKTCISCGVYDSRAISATGHKQYTAWSSNGDGTHSRNCTMGDDPQTERCTYTYAVIKPSTFDETGEGRYTCSVCGYSYTEEIPANTCSHEQTVVVGQQDATCTEAGYTGDVYCEICERIISTGQEQPAKGHTAVTDAAVPATCISTGLTEGSHCDVCGATIVEQTATPIDSSRHGDTEVRGKTEPNCIANGYSGDICCADCGAVITPGSVLPATGEHIEVFDSAVDPTCTESGLTEGSHCSACGITLIPQEIIPALGHDYSTDYTVDKKAAPSAAGKKSNHCTRCSAKTGSTAIAAPKTLRLSATTYTYSGSAKKPTVTVKDSSGAVIAASHYKVSYSNNKNPGKATVKVTFKGDTYEGSLSKTFTIKPKGTSLKSLTAGKKSFIVKWKKQATQVTGYEIQYSTNSKFKSGNETEKITSAKKTSVKIEKLKAKKTYYVRIRTYKTVNGKKYCSAWSDARKVKTKA